MALDYHVVGLGKVNEAVDERPVVVVLGWMDESPLQLVLGGYTVEFSGKNGPELTIFEVGRVDRSGPKKNVLLGGLLSQRGGSSAGNLDGFRDGKECPDYGCGL